ncbi:MAG: hypothetical protein EG823_08935, partial [Actinobacteria bacterium]|nr:hypothetical protein [Actinomycetota bacterium]
MRRSGRWCVLALLAVTLLAVLPASAAESTPSGTVVVVLAPYVTWMDVMGGSMPATRSLAESSAVGNLNVRSSMRFASDPTQSHVAVTMSAGSPSAFDPKAPAAYETDQRFESGTAGDAYMRATGNDPGSASIVYLGLARTVKAAKEGTFETTPGALGEAVVDAGGSTAAVGNSDGGYRSGEEYLSRPAAILAMDASGLVQYGDVSTALLVEHTDAPYGVATDTSALRAAYGAAIRDTAAHGGPAVIVLDAGDPERAFNSAQDSSPDAAEAHRIAAAQTVDRVVELALEGLPADGILMVVSTGQVKPVFGPSGFGPIVIHGPGFQVGTLSSASTHRAGLMTDLDVSATILEVLGIGRPVEILGNPASASPSVTSLEARIGQLTELRATAVAVDTVRPFVQNSYITITVLVLLACAALLAPMQRGFSGWGSRVAGLFGRV